MKVIGITGGIGSGKSRVLAFMEQEMGAIICQADNVAHELEQPHEVCYNAIVDHYGKHILKENQEIDRSRLGAIVFSQPDQLKVLNQIVHPAVKARIKEKIQAAKDSGAPYFVVEAALLMEDHYEEICDELWYIYASEETRRRRLKTQRGMDDPKIDAVFAAQSSEEIYRTYCDRVIDNSGSFEETCAQIIHIGEELL